jgi:hypothetical protein
LAPAWRPAPRAPTAAATGGYPSGVTGAATDGGPPFGAGVAAGAAGSDGGGVAPVAPAPQCSGVVLHHPCREQHPPPGHAPSPRSPPPQAPVSVSTAMAAVDKAGDRAGVGAGSAKVGDGVAHLSAELPRPRECCVVLWIGYTRFIV